MPTGYNQDVVAWAAEQGRLIRAGQFDPLDIEHVADEVEDVGRSEKRELASRMAVLLAHLLKWQFSPHIGAPADNVICANNASRSFVRFGGFRALARCWGTRNGTTACGAMR